MIKETQLLLITVSRNFDIYGFLHYNVQCVDGFRFVLSKYVCCQKLSHSSESMASSDLRRLRGIFRSKVLRRLSLVFTFYASNISSK